MIEARGYADAGLAAIADAAGVSRQSLYLHFGSRAGLLLELVAWVDEEEGLAELAAAVDSAATAEDALARYIDLVVTLTPRVNAVAAALEAARRKDPVADRAWRDRAERRRRRCRSVVRRLADEGRLAPGVSQENASDLVWTLTSRSTWEALVGDRGWSTRRYRTELLSLLRRGLLAR